MWTRIMQASPRAGRRMRPPLLPVYVPVFTTDSDKSCIMPVNFKDYSDFFAALSARHARRSPVLVRDLGFRSPAKSSLLRVLTMGEQRFGFRKGRA